MARIDLSIPSLGNKFIDLRDTMPGDSFNWSWVRSLSQVKYLAIHHSAGPDTQTPLQIANYHINSNGWGGIGYHFLVAKDGVVYYVGDISTARANVANLNDQVIGICLIGNFTQGRTPTNEQLDSLKKLCDCLINDYPDLITLNSYEVVLGHKELPGQSTVCPGDSWPSWKTKIISGGGDVSLSAERADQIAQAYKSVLGRDPDMDGLQTYLSRPMTIDQIIQSMVNSDEHQNLIKLGREAPLLKDQLNNLQTSLSSLNQKVISLQTDMAEQPIAVISPSAAKPDSGPKADKTLTIAGLLINLCKFLFWPRKDSLVGSI